MYLRAICATFALLSLVGVAYGQRSAASKITGEAYHLQSGSLYTRHAADHARVLRAYEGAPPAVVQEHSKAVKENVAKAKESLAKVKPLAKDDQSKQLVQALEKHYADCEAHCQKLAAGGDSAAVAECCQKLSKSLDAATHDHAELMKRLHVAPVVPAGDAK